MSRPLHFVGSLPLDLSGTPRQSMEWILGQTRNHQLTTLPCDLDSNWIVTYLCSLAERPAFEVKRSGDYTDYEDARRYGVRRGHRLTPSDVSMERVDRLREILQEYSALRAERSELADVRLQISLPNPLDLALFAFQNRPWLALRYLSIFSQATVEEVTALTAVAGRDVVWQFETPAVLVGMDMTKRLPGGRSLVARLLARQVASVLARLPDDAAVILHLCYGNLGNSERIAPRDLGPAVDYLNLLAADLRHHDRPLPPVHIPAAYGAHPSPRDAEFYRPLRRLDRKWQVIAGVAAASEPGGSAESLKLFETAADRQAYAVATACGLGRHTVDQAAKAVEAMAVAAEAP